MYYSKYKSTIQAIFVDNHPTLWRGVDAMCE